MSTFTIRSVTRLSDRDFDQYVSVVHVLSPGRHVQRGLIEQVLQHPEYLLLLAYDLLGDVVGTVRVMRKLQNDAIECVIDDLIVLPEWRGRGVARALMREAHHLGVLRYNAHRFVLTSNPSRTQARSLYVSLGYRPRSETTSFERQV